MAGFFKSKVKRRVEDQESIDHCEEQTKLYENLARVSCRSAKSSDVPEEKAQCKDDSSWLRHSILNCNKLITQIRKEELDRDPTLEHYNLGDGIFTPTKVRL
ncbi:MAG: hypothetical protein H0W64_02295 [Gammaproteobacteria bacterium]|nr:hypothetical protein [Gammaproteobacteria bacterium]